MSVASTSKVSSSSSPLKRTERRYGASAEGNAFVENIDTTNNVLVRDDSENDSQQKPAYDNPQQEEKKNTFSASPTYMSSSAIEALSASGVYDATDTDTAANSSLQKVNIYDNNKAIIGDDNDNSVDNPYIKHLYENNTILEEVDELV